MPNAPASPPPTNVAAAAALQFSVDCHPSVGDTQPSVLLLTQNMGGIEAAVAGSTILLASPSCASPASDATSDSSAFPAAIASMTAPSYIHVSDDLSVESGVPAVVRQQIADFLADIRTWLHRMAYVSAAARAAERASGVSSSAAAAGATANATTTPAVGTSNNNPSVSAASAAAPGQTAASYLRGYTPAARPLLIDVIVLHFQEIGGKYKNKQFNEYFKEQVRSVLLPEAGWTSGLLMDERESDRAVVSSSACRRVKAASSVLSPLRFQNASPISRSGHLCAPGWHGEGESQKNRKGSNEPSGGDNEAPAEEETAAADPYFTAVGSVVFVSPRVMGITSCLSVPHRTYIPIVDDPISYAGDAGRLFLARKFSEAGRSRKGYLMVSLRIGTVQFNLCNVHLFNDDDNRIALEHSPSRYADRRVRAVQEAMSECSAVLNFEEPLFIFGDYNIRLDGQAFVRWAEEKEQITIRPGKKQLRCPEHFWKLFADPTRLATFRLTFDREPQRLMDEVAMQTKVEFGEMPVRFAPTYSRLPYRQRGVAGTTATVGAPVPSATRKAGSVEDVQQLLKNEEEQEKAEHHRNVAIPSPPPMTSAAPTDAGGPLTDAEAARESLSHIAASLTRDNYSHDRLPAWCDRVFFNVAGLEWIAGDRARTASAAATSPASSPVVRDRRKTEQRQSSQPSPSSPQLSRRWYMYEGIDFLHMDHDGVYLLF